jgi:hypothetical protein
MVSMKKATRKIGDVTIQVEFKGLEYKWDFNRNAYTVTLKNDEGKRTSYTIYTNDKETLVTDLLMNDIIQNIVYDYSINEDNYSSYEEFASEFGYECSETRIAEYREGKKMHKECLKLGNKLKRVISKDWIENIELLNKLS